MCLLVPWSPIPSASCSFPITHNGQLFYTCQDNVLSNNTYEDPQCQYDYYSKWCFKYNRTAAACLEPNGKQFACHHVKLTTVLKLMIFTVRSWTHKHEKLCRYFHCGYTLVLYLLKPGDKIRYSKTLILITKLHAAPTNFSHKTKHTMFDWLNKRTAWINTETMMYDQYGLFQKASIEGVPRCSVHSRPVVAGLRRPWMNRTAL